MILTPVGIDIMQKLFKKNGIVSVIEIMLITKVLGLLKLRIIGDFFDASHELDIFWAGFTIPDIIFLVLIAGSINAAIIPIFSDMLYDKGKKNLDELFNKLSVLFSGAILFFTVIVFFLTPSIADLLISSDVSTSFLSLQTNLMPEDKVLFVQVMRIALLSPFILGISSFITAYLQVRKQFFVTTLAPLFYNLGMVIFSVFFVRVLGMGVTGIALSSIIGTFFHLIIQIPKFWSYYSKDRVPFINSLKNLFRDSAVIKTLKLAAPRILSILGEQVNVVINTVISFTLSPGALSAYNFAFRLHMFPINIIGSAVAQVTLPDLAKHSKIGDRKKFIEMLNDAIQFSMYLILPIVSIFVVLRLPIVRIVYGADGFGWDNTLLVAWCLVLLSVSIIGQTLMQIIMRAFYALKDTWKALVITMVGIVINVVCVLFLTNFFSHYYDWRIILDQIVFQIGEANSVELRSVLRSFFGDLLYWLTNRGDSRMAIGGLALAVSITYLVQTFVGTFFLNRITEVKLLTWEKTLKPILIKILNAVIMGVGMYFVFKIFDLQLDTTRTVWILILFGATCLYGGISYLVGTYLFKIDEFKHVQKFLKIFKDKILKRVV